jgi:hypothetical protein
MRQGGRAALAEASERLNVSRAELLRMWEFYGFLSLAELKAGYPELDTWDKVLARFPQLDRSLPRFKRDGSLTKQARAKLVREAMAAVQTAAAKLKKVKALDGEATRQRFENVLRQLHAEAAACLGVRCSVGGE